MPSTREGNERASWAAITRPVPCEARDMRSALAAALLLALAIPAWAEPVRVETRAIPGRDVKQVTAQGRIDAPPHVVRAVIADVERYAAVMPYVKESRVLARGPAGEIVAYQRLSFGIPFVQDRHYAIRIAERPYRDAAGRAWAFVWRLEDAIPEHASGDAVRVTVNSGHWDLRPIAGVAGATDVRYCVFTDPAGSLPKWIAGLANSEGVPQLFAAVATAAADPRYATAPVPGDAPSAGGPALDDCADATR